MKVTTVIVAVVWLAVILVPQANARSVLVERVTSALQGSFDSLNSKRQDWFNNYSTMNNVTKTSTTYLRELQMISKMALPLIWNLYSTTVWEQKKFYPTVVKEGPQSLPFHAHISDFTLLSLGHNVYLEATLLLQQHRDFQVQILRETKEIFFLKFNFNERRAVIGHSEQNEVTEEAVLADDDFPAITLNQPFRINVQIMDDCIVASIWLTNLHLTKPMPLPKKHIWCTRDYTTNTNLEYSFNIHPIGGYLRQSPGEDENQHQDHVSQEEQEHDISQEQQGYQFSQEEQGHHFSQEEQGHHFSQEEQEHHVSQEEQQVSQESHEEDREEASDMKLVSAVVYSGIILQ